MTALECVEDRQHTTSAAFVAGLGSVLVRATALVMCLIAQVCVADQQCG